MQENPTVWLFDLDNTLHDADAGIFHLINRAMTRYMARRLKLSESAASDLRQDYWHRYGATLAGLQIHHPEIDIAEFLRESHPIDAILTRLHGMADTENTLCRLNGRKAVFSNGPSFYVRAVAGALGLENCFDALFGTDDFGLLYKPNPQAYLNSLPPVGRTARMLHYGGRQRGQPPSGKSIGHENRPVRCKIPHAALYRCLRKRYGATGTVCRNFVRTPPKSLQYPHPPPENTKECYA